MMSRDLTNGSGIQPEFAIGHETVIVGRARFPSGPTLGSFFSRLRNSDLTLRVNEQDNGHDDQSGIEHSVIWLCNTSGCWASGFIKQVAVNVANGEAPTLLQERLEIRFSEYLDRLFTGINLNSNRRSAKVYLVASSVRSASDRVGLITISLQGPRNDRICMAKTADLAVAFVSGLCVDVQSNRTGNRLGDNAVCTDRRICA